MVVFYKITYSFGCKISVINGPFFAAVVVLNLQIPPRLVHTHLVAGMAISYGSPLVCLLPALNLLVCGSFFGSFFIGFSDNDEE